MIVNEKNMAAQELPQQTRKGINPQDRAEPAGRNAQEEDSSVSRKLREDPPQETRKKETLVERLLGRSIRFEIDKELNEVIVKVVDKENGEVVRQIPPEEYLEIMRRLQDIEGAFLDKEA
ncbi:flagellar protein FlaG [bacterium BMS3Abin08]|nr:flagellar protein FlaG [bacterium BMS3Abin08]